MLSEEDRLLEAKDVLMTTLGHPGQVLKSEDAQVAEVRPIPVILLCGFLGAGKTTLLNHILRSPDHGLKSPSVARRIRIPRFVGE